MKPILRKTASCGITSITLIMALAMPVQAETITIGKGTGILWEGMPFNETLGGSLDSPVLWVRYGLLSISSISSRCMDSSSLKSIGGYQALPLNGVPGVGLIPRATGTATYTRNSGVRQEMTGTIGLPDTKGSSTSDANVSSPSGYAWCLPPSMTENDNFYSSSGTRSATLSGTWVLVADGTQKAGEVTMPAMYFGSYSRVGSGDKKVSILPQNISLRISTLECTVNTPTTIDFGAVIRNTKAYAELAVKPVQLVTTCGQTTDKINANINLQFLQTSGLYDGAASRLALKQGGGYITGEIDGGVTGSGACTATTGLKFDNTPVKQGNITNTQSSKTLTNQLTWRLCSGGSSLPTGAVTASTEMLVTFN